MYDRYGNYLRPKPSAIDTAGRLLGFSDASSVDAFMGQQLYTDREDAVLNQKKKLTDQLIGALLPQFDITDKEIDRLCVSMVKDTERRKEQYICYLEDHDWHIYKAEDWIQKLEESDWS